MKTIFLLMAVVMVFAAVSVPLPSRADGCTNMSGYYVASLNGAIDPGTADFIGAAVGNAESQCAGHFVLVLQTNGGDGGSMESIIGSISGYRSWGGSFTTLVAPQGAYAFSAGAYIAESSNKVYMVPGTAIGSATPIVSGIPTGEENTTLTKDINAFKAYMETLTASNGRNSTATGLMVSRGVSYKCETPASCQAANIHVIDGVLNATSVQVALALLGVPSTVAIESPGIRSQLISILSDPNVSSLLFLLGVFMVLADIYHPTIVLSVVGVVTIALSLFGLGIFGASPLAVLLMVIGAAFIFLEVKTQHGVSAAIGVVIFVLGFLLIYEFPPASPTLPSLPAVTFSPISEITYGLFAVLGVAIVIASLYLRSVRLALLNKPKVNDPSMTLGKDGVMESDLAPGGKGVALVMSEQWTVTSDVELKKGDAIRVKEVRGLALVVEKRT